MRAFEAAPSPPSPSLKLGLLMKIFETLGTPTPQTWPEFHENSYTVQWSHSQGRALESVSSVAGRRVPLCCCVLTR